MWSHENYELGEIVWRHTMKEEGYVTITSDITGKDFLKDEEVSLGLVDVHVFDEEWGDMLVAADAEGDAIEVIGTLTSVPNDFQRVAVLNHIQIGKEFQQKGLGTYVMTELQEYLRAVLNVDVVLLVAWAGTGEEIKTKELVRFYESIGYSAMTDEEDNHLWINLHNASYEKVVTVGFDGPAFKFWEFLFRYGKSEVKILEDRLKQKNAFTAEVQYLMEEMYEMYESHINHMKTISPDSNGEFEISFSALGLALAICDLELFAKEIEDGIAPSIYEVEDVDIYSETFQRICEDGGVEEEVEELIKKYRTELVPA